MTHLAALITPDDIPTIEGLLAAESLTRLTLITPKPIYLIHPKLHQLTSLNQHWANWDWMKSVYDFFRDSTPDAVYGIGSRRNIGIASFLGRLAKIPVILSLEDLNPRPHWYWQRILSETALVTVPHHWWGEDLMGYFALSYEQLMVLPPMIQFPPYTPQSRNFEAVYPLYGQEWDELAVDVWWHVVSKIPQARMVMVGTAHPELNSIIARLGLRDHILLTEGDLTQWVKASQLYLAWQTESDLPQTVINVMAQGTIPIHHLSGNIEYIVEDGRNGLLFDDPTETRLIARSIIEVLNDPVFYSRLQAEALKIPDQFSLPIITEAWTEILAHVQRMEENHEENLES